MRNFVLRNLLTVVGVLFLGASLQARTLVCSEPYWNPITWDLTECDDGCYYDAANHACLDCGIDHCLSCEPHAPGLNYCTWCAYGWVVEASGSCIRSKFAPRDPGDPWGDPELR